MELGGAGLFVDPEAIAAGAAAGAGSELAASRGNVLQPEVAALGHASARAGRERDQGERGGE